MFAVTEAFTHDAASLPIVILSAVGVAFSPVGRRMALSLPLVALVGFQSFRIIVELTMHRAYVEGLMPVQMSYSGRNFDIVTGVTAALVAIWFARGHRSTSVLFAWNTLGLALLVNVLVVAFLSAPTPVRVFMNEPANAWITRAPWIWLPQCSSGRPSRDMRWSIGGCGSSLEPSRGP